MELEVVDICFINDDRYGYTILKDYKLELKNYQKAQLSFKINNSKSLSSCIGSEVENEVIDNSTRRKVTE